LQNSLPKINESLKNVQSAYDSTIQVANLEFTISNAFSALGFGISNNSTATLNQNDLFDASIKKALLMTDQLPTSNAASQISNDLKKLKSIGDLAFVQSATLVGYQNKIKLIQSNLSNVENEYTQTKDQISNLMTLNKTMVATIETSFTTVAASANDLYSLPATESQLILARLNSRISALPINQLNIANTENLLDNLALLVGTNEAQNMVSSMKLALKNIYLATSQDNVDIELVLMRSYIQSFKTDMNMGALNPVGISYADLLLDRYYSLSQQLGNLVMKAQNDLSEIQSISATVNDYNQKISSQRDSMVNLLTVDAKRYLNSINASLSSLFDKANSSTQSAMNDFHISSDPISNAFNYILTITFIITVVASVCIIVFGIFLIFDLKRNLRNLQNATDKMKAEDLSVKIEETNRKDEFGNLQKSFNEMIDHLKGVFSHFKQLTSSVKDDLKALNSMEDESSSGMKVAITEIDKSKDLMKKFSEELEEITQRLSKIDESEKSAMGRIESLDELYGDSKAELSDTKKRIDDFVAKLLSTKEEAIKNSKYIEDLKASYTPIFNLTKTLESMTDQAKILALNIAIRSSKEKSDQYAFLESEAKELANESASILEEIKTETKQFQDKIEKALLESESVVTSMKHLSDSGEEINDLNLDVIFDRMMKDVKEISETIKLTSERAQVNQNLQEKIKLLEEAIPLLESASRSLDEGKITDIKNLMKKIEETSESLDQNVKKFKTD